ncbi:hypothetical protein [Mesorhizobium sp. WSM2239]|uniref:Uncharacterized protein n=2 Tax=unclassified Mesorhizobium TaxID=325217 RepID=A0AAU8DIJ7_9HYPH
MISTEATDFPALFAGGELDHVNALCGRDLERPHNDLGGPVAPTQAVDHKIAEHCEQSYAAYSRHDPLCD